MSRQSLHGWSVDFDNLQKQFKAPVPNDMVILFTKLVGNLVKSILWFLRLKKLSCRQLEESIINS